jgi:hypothetical protein
MLPLAVAALATAGPPAGLTVTSLGKSYRPDPARVPVQQTRFNPGGSTSVRNNADPALEWKPQGYYRRNRDLGQVFTPPADFTLDAIVLRTGPSDSAVLAGAPGAGLFVQFFEVTGTPRINDNGTPPGTDAKHGFGKNHRCDDFLEGVTYSPLRVVGGGVFPAVPPTKDAADNPTGDAGKLVYLRWAVAPADRLTFRKGQRYAFLVGFSEPGQGRGFTLANMNNASKPDAPALDDEHDPYHGGWGLRREGDGTTPPTMVPGPTPPAGAARAGLVRQSLFATGAARFALPPTTDGYPDVCTYRDLEFYLETSAPGGGGRPARADGPNPAVWRPAPGSATMTGPTPGRKGAPWTSSGRLGG